MTLVTLSAPYGAGGSQVGPAVAERLGVPLVDRDESVGSWLSRALLSFGQVGPVLAGATPVPETMLTEDTFREATEQVLRQHAAEGAVILGRAGAVVLRDHPGALHVRLTGPEEGRIAQGMRLEGVDRETALRHIEETDR